MQKILNQSDLHNELTLKTKDWLLSKTANGRISWRQEHTLPWIKVRPDAVAFCTFDHKFYNELCNNNTVLNQFLIVFETKISKSDFDSTFKNGSNSKLNPFAHFHFLVLPKKFIQVYRVDNLPEYWGILEQSGKGLKLVKKPVFQKLDRSYIYEVAYTFIFEIPISWTYFND